jgi:hypothetical protein
VSKVLELNSRVVHASVKGLTLLNFFEFLLEFSNEKSACNVQCDRIDDKKDPFDTSPFLKHPFTSERGPHIDVNISGWTANASETRLFLNHVLIKTRRKFLREWNIAFEKRNHAGSTRS